MKQQVNLYQPIFRKPQVFLSATIILRIAGLSLLLLAGVYGYVHYRVSSDEATLGRLQRRAAEAASVVAEIQRMQAEPQTDANLERRIEEAAAELRAKRRLLGALEDQGLGAAGGFGELLAGLARRRVEGLWLTELAITDGGRNLALYGASDSPEHLPRLLGELRHEPAFSGREFQSLQVQSAGESSRLEFRLTGEQEPAP